MRPRPKLDPLGALKSPPSGRLSLAPFLALALTLTRLNLNPKLELELETVRNAIQMDLPVMSAESRANQLYALYMEARRLVEDLSRSLEAMGQPPAAELHSPAHTHSQATSSCSLAAGSGQQQQQLSPSASLSGQTANGLQAPTSPAASPQQQQQLMLATGSLLSNALLEVSGNWRDLWPNKKISASRCCLGAHSQPALSPNWRLKVASSNH